MPEADCDRPHAATSSSSQLRRILDDVVLPCLHHWHGTGCHQRSFTSGTISRWNLSSLNSRLIYSTALTSTIISIILGWHWYACSRKSHHCNGLAETCYGALEIVWYYYYYYYTNLHATAGKNPQINGRKYHKMPSLKILRKVEKWSWKFLTRFYSSKHNFINIHREVTNLSNSTLCCGHIPISCRIWSISKRTSLP